MEAISATASLVPSCRLNNVVKHNYLQMVNVKALMRTSWQRIALSVHIFIVRYICPWSYSVKSFVVQDFEVVRHLTYHKHDYVPLNEQMRNYKRTWWERQTKK